MILVFFNILFQIGTIYLNETYGMAFDIIPVVLSENETRRQKRDTDYNNGLFHGLFRRPVDDSSSKLKSFSVPASSSFRVSSDFAEVPKGGFPRFSFIYFDINGLLNCNSFTEASTKNGFV